MYTAIPFNLAPYFRSSGGKLADSQRWTLGSPHLAGAAVVVTAAVVMLVTVVEELVVAAAVVSISGGQRVAVSLVAPIARM